LVLVGIPTTTAPQDIARRDINPSLESGVNAIASDEDRGIYGS
jgi:hypothetical protein